MNNKNTISTLINNEIDRSNYNFNKHHSYSDLIIQSLDDDNHLYKYLSLDKSKNTTKEEISYIEQIIKNSSIKFSNPRQFNDPFDCMTVQPIVNKEKIVELCKNKTNIPTENITDKDWVEINTNLLEQRFDHIINKFGVLCFSGNWDNILMWSHYASEHKGFVLIFKFDRSSSFYSKIRKVIYKECVEFFDIDHKNSHIKIQEMFSTKNNIWKYEEEYRIIHNPDTKTEKYESGIKIFPKKLLQGIIFGINCNNEHINQIKTWVNIHNPSLKLFQATPKTPYTIGIDKKRLT